MIRFCSAVVPGEGILTSTCTPVSFWYLLTPAEAIFQKSLALLVTNASLGVAPSGALWTALAPFAPALGWVPLAVSPSLHPPATTAAATTVRTAALRYTLQMFTRTSSDLLSLRI